MVWIVDLDRAEIWTLWRNKTCARISFIKLRRGARRNRRAAEHFREPRSSRRRSDHEGQINVSRYQRQCARHLKKNVRAIIVEVGDFPAKTRDTGIIGGISSRARG